MPFPSTHGDGKVPLPRLLLRMDLIQPGDVILTRGSEKESKLITTLSSAPYSHAAFYLHDGTTFESDGGIVGYRSVTLLGWADIDGRKTPLGFVAGNPELCAVYRYPHLTTLLSQDLSTLRSKLDFESQRMGYGVLGSIPDERLMDTVLSERLGDQIQESYGLDYSEYHRLVRLANLPTQFRSLITQAVKLYDWSGANNKVPGPFCSELVARLFSSLNLPLFNDDRIPEKVTPSDLANSKLVCVPDVVVNANDITLTEFSTKPDVFAAHHSKIAKNIRNMNLGRKQFNREVERGNIRLLTDEQYLAQEKTFMYSSAKSFLKDMPIIDLAEEARNSKQEALRGHAVRLCIRYVDIASNILKEVREATSLKDVLMIGDRIIAFHASFMRIYALVESERLKNEVKSEKWYGFIMRPLRIRNRRKIILGTRRCVIDASPSVRALAETGKH